MARQRLGELRHQRYVKIGPRREHAVIIGRRSPDLAQRALRHQTPALHCLPERAADRAGIGAAVEHGANDLDLARAGIAMLADIAVEAQRAVVPPLNEAFALEKMNRQDRSMAAVAAAERQRAVPRDR